MGKKSGKNEQDNYSPSSQLQQQHQPTSQNKAKRGRPKIKKTKKDSMIQQFDNSQSQPGQDKIQNGELISQQVYSPIQLIKYQFSKFYDSVNLVHGLVFKPKEREAMRAEQQKIGGTTIPKIQWDQMQQWQPKQQQQKIDKFLAESNKNIEHNAFLPSRQQLLELSQFFPRQVTLEIHQIILQLTIILAKYSTPDKTFDQSYEIIPQFAKYVHSCQFPIDQKMQQQQKEQQGWSKYQYYFINGKFSKQKKVMMVEKNAAKTKIGKKNGKQTDNKKRKTLPVQIQLHHLQDLFFGIAKQLKQLHALHEKQHVALLDRPIQPIRRHNECWGIGMMSGTSLDGIDLVYCCYYKTDSNSSWEYQLYSCKTYPYPPQILQLLQQLSHTQISYLTFKKKQIYYSGYLAQIIQRFIQQEIYTKSHINYMQSIGFNDNVSSNGQISFIAVHGHTIYHQPAQSITIQITDLNYIAAKLKIDVIGNFRQFDVHCGGQGAPLAPYGQQLFNSILNNTNQIQQQQQQMQQQKSSANQTQAIYLNLGGIANIGFTIQSSEHSNKYETYGTDIGFCNIVFNHYASHITNNKQQYDHNGQLGIKGKVNQNYVNKLNQSMQKYNKYPLSLGRQQLGCCLLNDKTTNNYRKQLHQIQRQFLEEQIKQFVGNDSNIQVIDDSIKQDAQSNMYDQLRTHYQILAHRIVQCCWQWAIPIIANSCRQTRYIKLVCTGGGTYNSTLISLIKQRLADKKHGIKMSVLIPPKQIIEFKQAIIFGLLGVKYLHRQMNCRHGTGGMLVKGSNSQRTNLQNSILF